MVIWDVDPVPCTPTCLQTRNGIGKQIAGRLMSVQEYLCISQTSNASLLAIILSMTVSHKHAHKLTQTYNRHPSTYPYQLLKPGIDSVCTTASGDNFFVNDVCVSVVRIAQVYFSLSGDMYVDACMVSEGV